VSTTEHPAPGAGTAASEDPYLVVERSPKFRDLRGRYHRFIFPMGAAFLIWYFLLMYLAGWHRAWMATPVWGAINIGMIFALSEFATTFGIAFIYTRYADRNIDPGRHELRAEVEHLQHVRATTTTGA
jgi:uncharacterized membrane protein (DUF485 family)